MCHAAKSHAHGCCVTGAGFFLQNGGYCKIVTVPICNLLNNVLPWAIWDTLVVPTRNPFLVELVQRVIPKTLQKGFYPELWKVPPWASGEILYEELWCKGPTQSPSTGIFYFNFIKKQFFFFKRPRAWRTVNFLQCFSLSCTNYLLYCQTHSPVCTDGTDGPDLLWRTSQETNGGIYLWRDAVSIIEILSMLMCEEYNKSSRVRGGSVWIIASNVIISLRVSKLVFSFH